MLFSLPKFRTPVFATLDFMRPFKLEVDASASCAGEVLLQKDEQGVDHPIGYFLRKFNIHQQNYSTIDKDALSLLLALPHFGSFWRYNIYRL